MHDYCLPILTLLSLGCLIATDVNDQSLGTIDETTTINYETSPADSEADTTGNEINTQGYEISTEDHETSTEGYEMSTEGQEASTGDFEISSSDPEAGTEGYEVTTEDYGTTDIANETSTVDYEVHTSLPMDWKTVCVEDLKDWCNRNNFLITDDYLSILSFSYFDFSLYSRIFCSLAYNGAECMKDRSPWFHCYPNGTLVYYSVYLDDSDSDSDIDDYICKARDAALKLNFDMRFDKVIIDHKVRRILWDIQDFFQQFLILKNMFDNVKKQVVRYDPNILYIGTEFGEIIGKK